MKLLEFAEWGKDYRCPDFWVPTPFCAKFHQWRPGLGPSGGPLLQAPYDHLRRMGVLVQSRLIVTDAHAVA